MRRYYRSIRFRLLVLSAVLIGILVATDLNLRIYLRQEADAEARETVAIGRLNQYLVAEQGLQRARHLAWQMISSSYSGSADSFAQAKLQWQQERDALRARLEGPARIDTESAQRIREEVDSTTAVLDPLQLRPPAEAATALAAFVETRAPLAAATNRRLQAAINSARVELDEVHQQHVRGAVRGRRLSLLMTLGGLLAGVLLVTVILRSIFRPLSRTVHALRAVSAGRVPETMPALSDDEFGEVARAVRDVQRYAEKLDDLAHNDALTGLSNRSRIELDLRDELAQREHAREALALLFLDLDEFGYVNDSLGHAAGDAYLREAAYRLRALVDGGAWVGRYGSDKFMIVLRRLSEQPRAAVAEFCNGLLRGLSEPVTVDSHTLHMSASIGAALFPDDGQSVERLMTRADAAMFEAKRAGRNCLRFATQEVTAGVHTHLQIAADIRRAIAAGEFEPYYQPVVDVHTGAVVSVEALTRWKHPTRGLLLPAEFIPVAEASGLIGELGEDCLDQVCRQMADWRSQGRELKVAVNLSARQLQDPHLLSKIRSRVQAAKIAPERLDLEITETVLIETPERSRIQLEGLVAQGHSIAMDDFGTGYSSLSYLQRFPIQKLKIDRSFVSRLEEGGSAEAIVRATLDMARGLNMTTVAEGVERPAQVQKLRALGCVELQGFYFSKALAASALEAWLDRGAAPDAGGLELAAAL